MLILGWVKVSRPLRGVNRFRRTYQKNGDFGGPETGLGEGTPYFEIYSSTFKLLFFLNCYFWFNRCLICKDSHLDIVCLVSMKI